MRKFLFVTVLLLTMYSCQKEEIALHSGACSIPATVVDALGFDGCGYMIVLDDGEVLMPIITFYCGTPPRSGERINNPLYRFELRDQQRVMIDYEVPETSYYNICMSGTPVNITCIEEMGSSPSF